MSHRQIGFDDERRRSVPHFPGDNLRADTYRPSELKDRARESDRDRYKDGNRDYTRDRDRRDDRRVDRQPEQSPRRTLSSDQGKGDDTRPRSIPLSKIDTSVLSAPKGPRTPRTQAPLSGNASPVISRGGPATTASLATSTTAPDTSKSAASRPSSPSNNTMPAPKALCSEQQPAMDAMYKLVDFLYWRYKYQMESNGKSREIEARDQEAKKWKAQQAMFPQQLKLNQGAKERLIAERTEFETKFKRADAKMASLLKAAIAELVNCHSTSHATVPEKSTVPFVDTAPMLAMEQRMTALEKRCTDSQTAANDTIQTLRSERAAADRKIKELTDRWANAEKQIEQVKHNTENAFKELQDTNEKEIRELKNDRATTEEEVKNLKALLARLSKKETVAIDKDARQEIRDAKENLDSVKKSVDSCWSYSTQSFKTAEEQRKRSEKEVQESMEQLQHRASSLESLTNDDTRIKSLEAKFDQGQQNVAKLEVRLGVSEQALSNCEDLSQNVNNMTAEISKLKGTFNDLQVAFNDIDRERIEEILDDWTTHNFGDMILESSRLVKDLQTDVGSLKTLKPQASHLLDGDSRDARHNQQAPSLDMRESLEGSMDDEIRQELSSLKGEIHALKKSISEGEKSLLEKVQSTVMQSNELMGGEIDGIDNRTNELSHRVGILESKGVQARTPAPTPQHDTRVSPVTIDSHLANRIKAIEDADLVTSLSNITQKLDQYCQSFDQSRRDGGAEEINMLKMAYQNLNNALKELSNKVRGQLDQQELQLQNMNAHFNNMNTRAMAQTILSQLDSYTTRFGPQFDIVNARLDRVEGRFDTFVRLFQPDPNAQDQTNKRPTGSLDLDAANKRRRMASGSPAFGTPAFASFSGSGSGSVMASPQQIQQQLQPQQIQLQQMQPRQMQPQQMQQQHMQSQQMQQMPTQPR